MTTILHSLVFKVDISLVLIFIELLLCRNILGLLHRLVEDLPSFVLLTLNNRLLKALHYFSGQQGQYLCLVHHVVDERLMFVEEWEDDPVVDDTGPVTIERRHAPDKEETLAETMSDVFCTT